MLPNEEEGQLVRCPRGWCVYYRDGISEFFDKLSLNFEVLYSLLVSHVRNLGTKYWNLFRRLQVLLEYESQQLKQRYITSSRPDLFHRYTQSLLKVYLQYHTQASLTLCNQNRCSIYELVNKLSSCNGHFILYAAGRLKWCREANGGNTVQNLIESFAVVIATLWLWVK